MCIRDSAYTKQGDLSGIQYADGKEVKLSYNPLRQLIEIQDWLGSTRITPDELGRAEKVQYPDGREAVSYTHLDVYKRQFRHQGLSSFLIGIMTEPVTM